MTIVESIKCVLQQNNDGLTSKQMLELSLMKLLDGMELLFAVSKDTPR